tara:strand:- start:1722 stop:2909 length:1188 start_codon:yes stop_codon:yes gene_type:complete
MGIIYRYLVLFIILFQSKISYSKPIIISLDEDIYNEAYSNNLVSQTITQQSGINYVYIDSENINKLSSLSHKKFHRCGGFIEEEFNSLFHINIEDQKKFQEKMNIKDLAINRPNIVENSIKYINERIIFDNIKKLSSFQNRYYKSEHGYNSQMWIKQKWQDKIRDKEREKTETFHHSGFTQPSIILTLEGTKKPDEIIIIGGHGDSIAGWNPNNKVKAPGADDNASGIATITEIIRVLQKISYKPERTIKFISYAAEEVGLKGSNNIAKNFKKEKKNIKAVMQFDMTNFSGSSFDIVLIEDYTTPDLNRYLVDLIEIYLPDLSISFDKCGYACSDHASWYRQGYPVVYPFESTFSTYNKDIHSHKDTLEQSDNTADHAVNFVKLGLAFAIESSSI